MAARSDSVLLEKVEPEFVLPKATLRCASPLVMMDDFQGEGSYQKLDTSVNQWAIADSLHGCSVIIAREKFGENVHMFHIHPEQVLRPITFRFCEELKNAKWPLEIVLITTDATVIADNKIISTLEEKFRVMIEPVQRVHFDSNQKHAAVLFNAYEDSLIINTEDKICKVKNPLFTYKPSEEPLKTIPSEEPLKTIQGSFQPGIYTTNPQPVENKRDSEYIIEIKEILKKNFSEAESFFFFKKMPEHVEHILKQTNKYDLLVWAAKAANEYMGTNLMLKEAYNILARLKDESLFAVTKSLKDLVEEKPTAQPPHSGLK